MGYKWHARGNDENVLIDWGSVGFLPLLNDSIIQSQEVSGSDRNKNIS